MDFFHDIIDHPRIFLVLTLLQSVFTIWMVIDAYQRSAETFWFFLIFMFQPFGSWIYFFVHKLPTLRVPGRTGSNWYFKEKRLSFDELQYRVDRSPTVKNRLMLAERLMERREFSLAIPQLQAALAQDDTYCQAMHDLAVCFHECNRLDDALDMLDRLMKRDARWSDYRGWKTLIQVHEDKGDAPAALMACRELEKRRPSWENRCHLAELLLENDRKPEAIQLLEQALEDYQFAPLGKKIRDWSWARQARRLLQEAET